MYDYLIVGAGLSGSIASYLLSLKGYKVLVIDKRNHIGGNCYTVRENGITIHKYGAHIFHTSNKKVWSFINKFIQFNNYIHLPVALYNNEIYNLPFNMNTFIKLYPNLRTPEEIITHIQSKCIIKNDYNNLEEWVLGNVGTDIYEKLIKHYTEKLWNTSCDKLDTDIIKRLPLRFNYNNNYFNDIYQGIPINGYTELFNKLLYNCDIQLNTDYFDNRKYFNNIAKNIIYTGPIDKFYNYLFGKLSYRSLIFKQYLIDKANYQGNSVINYTDAEHKYTRIIEHKHFECLTNELIYSNPKTIITEEYPEIYNNDNEPYYPILNEYNINLYNLYKKLADNETNIMFIGRLAEYKYFDMDDTIENVFKKLNIEYKL